MGDGVAVVGVEGACVLRDGVLGNIIVGARVVGKGVEVAGVSRVSNEGAIVFGAGVIGGLVCGNKGSWSMH